MAKSHQQQIDELRRDVAAQARTIAEQGRTIDILDGEHAALRLLLAAHGIASPEPLDESYVSVSRFAELHCLSSEAVLSRIRRNKVEAVKRGGRWFVKCDLHGCTEYPCNVRQA